MATRRALQKPKDTAKRRARGAHLRSTPATAPPKEFKLTKLGEGPPPVPPPSALKSGAKFRAWLKSLGSPPKNFYVGQDLIWDAPWIDVTLRVELPFWLLVDNTTIPIDVNGHTFPVSLHCETFELHLGWISDSKQYILYQGPFLKTTKLSRSVRAVLRAQRGKHNTLWRKCKTVLKIVSRCNEDVWIKRMGKDQPFRPSVRHYMEELCRAHIPVVNTLIRQYRLTTYDFFAFEVAPWDVPYWQIEREGQSCNCLLVPYRGWDHVPTHLSLKDDRPRFVRLIEPNQLQNQTQASESPGELDLLDAINFMERGNYSDAVRRITTAVEVMVEAKTAELVANHEGNQAAELFLKKTRMDFWKRIEKYEALSQRKLAVGLRREIERTRNLRHRIVHRGYRINSGERNEAQRAVDTGRWIFNWFENDAEHQKVRETRIAYRSLGRDTPGIFRSKIAHDGVIISSPFVQTDPPAALFSS